MNQGTLEKAYAEKRGVGTKEANEALNTFLELIGDSLVTGEKVMLVNLGTFTPKVVPEHTARNPLTGAPVTVPEKIVTKYKESTALRKRINGTA